MTVPAPRTPRPAPRRAARPAPGGPPLLALLAEDLRTVRRRDPSRRSTVEALLHAPWHGLVLHRCAHRLYVSGHRVGAGVLTHLGRLLSGMDIHAGARLGRRVFLDHGFGVVIGETAVVGDDVTIYHRVTLGSRGWWKDGHGPRRRHPVIGDGVLIGVGASVLGPVTVAAGTHIAAHRLVTADIGPGPEPRETPPDGPSGPSGTGEASA